MSAFGGNNGNFGDSKRVKTDIPEEEQPSLIINQVSENLRDHKTTCTKHLCKTFLGSRASSSHNAKKSSRIAECI